MNDTTERCLSELKAEDPPRRVWRDYALVVVVLISITLELILREDVRENWGAALFVAMLSFSLLWRRTKPLLSFVVGFGGVLLLDLGSVVGGYNRVDIFSGAVILVSMYSLFRWGSGKKVLVGSLLGLLLYAESIIFDYTGLSDVIGGLLVLEFPAAIGVAVRYFRQSQRLERDQIRVTERERIARELHDTLAHHVSAIAIQAQAGQVVAEAGSLPGASEALASIEEEASRTLTGMRSVVGSLRDPDAPVEMAPQHTIADVENLATTVGVPPVKVSLAEEVGDVGPTIGAAVYRIAQESVTNARRHSQNATRVDVVVDGAADQVVLTVTDDGDLPANPSGQGFGLVGMAERATQLGGTLDAGPGPVKGWLVRARLPAELRLQDVK